jgi:hypothetical protein
MLIWQAVPIASIGTEGSQFVVNTSVARVANTFILE